MGKWCLITGASGGIGAALAREAAGAGFDLVLSGRDTARLDGLAKELRGIGREAVCIAADLAQPGAAEALWREASAGREIDILMNNAGLGIHGPVQAPAIRAQVRATVAVNVVAMTELLMLAAEDMAARGHGRILNVSSSAAFMPGPGMASYHAAKAFSLYLSEAAAVDLKGSGVSVTALCPGPTATGFFDVAEMGGVMALRFLPKATAQAIARAGWSGLMRGKRVVVPGLLYKLIAFSTRFTPRPVLLWSAKLFWRK
ncbi:SDR family NAD(P)-dependent oxidoreductase [Aquicoccus sp. G2-2]|uniref:SDR family NAD(P)-dependent oxidoreductase n=1 Tax=Aquicoccus sp. G2-2 TaxID=3092120 RepID=UPI002AE025DC|nr:SDR family NAD(P)-dependent oxidoreductase [Aquicoccus sp. G2-2]MEA1112869.1 SDR family NAD(P)-dependent oxidoreductase [Aquicoccus sp. G2-2]